MKAALYQGIRNIDIAEWPDYECGDDAIVLQNIYSSICGTDVAVYHHGLGMGHRITIGGEFGHETVGCRAARRGLPQEGEKAVVFGARTIGIAAAMALKHFGCKQVVICDHSDFRLEICRQLGFDGCNNREDHDLSGLAEILGKSVGINGTAVDCDIWIDAAGADSVLSAYEQFWDARWQEPECHAALRSLPSQSCCHPCGL